MTAPLPLRATRRGALVGTLAVLTATGCDAVAPSRPVEADTEADPDDSLVVEVRADLARASVTITSAIDARPGLRPELAPFGVLHARHLQALDGDRPRGRRPVRGGSAAVRKEVRTLEVRLQESLAAAALAARSGPLAALLASMSAAVAQQLSATEAA